MVNSKKKSIKLKTKTSNRTISQAKEEFLLDCKSRGLSEYTIINYGKAIRYFAEWRGNINITEITDTNLKEWAVALRETHSQNTTRTFVKTVRIFLRYFGIEFDMENPRAEQKILPVYTEEEVKKLIAPPTRESFGRYRTHAIVCFLFSTGVRTQTIINIKIRDVNFKDNTIFLAKTKTLKQYTIPMSSQLKKVLKDYLKLYDHNDDDWLFPNIYGEQLSPDALRQLILEYHRARGVRTYSVHKYRRTFATHFNKTNGNVFALQLLLGHSDVSTTRKYCNISVGDIENYDDFNLLDNSKKEQIKVKKK